MSRLFTYITVIGAVLFLVGCAGPSKPYTQQGKKNLTVDTEVESGVSATLEIYKVEGKCQNNLEGRVSLKEGNNRFSLLENQLYYLSVEFSSYSFISGSSSTTSLGTYVYIKPNNRYRIKTLYKDGMFDVVFTKRDIRSNTTREMKLRPLEECADRSSGVSVTLFPALGSMEI
jgi:hypothetical protein